MLSGDESMQNESIKVKCKAEDCHWEKVFASRDEFLVFLLRWSDFHKHFDSGSFLADVEFSILKDKTNFRKGDVFIFKTRENNRSEDNPVTTMAPDGRIGFFDREDPVTPSLAPAKRVKGKILEIKEKYIIVSPVEIMGNMERYEDLYPEAV